MRCQWLTTTSCKNRNDLRWEREHVITKDSSRKKSQALTVVVSGVWSTWRSKVLPPLRLTSVGCLDTDNDNT